MLKHFNGERPQNVQAVGRSFPSIDSDEEDRQARGPSACKQEVGMDQQKQTEGHVSKMPSRKLKLLIVVYVVVF